jgi:hypothetical protein
VGEEAAEVLRTLRGPLGVVAVCGRARQGKSFILNQLATHGHAAAHREGWLADDNQMDMTDSSVASGFAVAPTHRPCTKVRSHSRRAVCEVGSLHGRVARASAHILAAGRNVHGGRGIAGHACPSTRRVRTVKTRLGSGVTRAHAE